jgi:type I restriction enzyme R subunit
MEDLADLMKPPFDKPLTFVKLFDMERQAQLIGIINTIKDNAIKPAA